MKPDTRLFDELRRVERPAAPEKRAATADDECGPRARRQSLEDAIERVAELRKSRALSKQLDGLVTSLRQYDSRALPEQPAGTIGVRVLAASEKVRKNLPVGAVKLELLLSEKVVASALSDTTGLAFLQVPSDFESGKYAVRAVASNGEVLGRFDGEVVKGRGATHVLELGRATAVLPHLTRGERWEAAAEAAEKKATVLKSIVEKSLERLEAALKSQLDADDPARGAAESHPGGTVK